MAGPSSPASKQRLQADLDSMAASLRQQAGDQVQVKPSVKTASSRSVPRRLTVLPLYETAFDNMSAQDRQWWSTQQLAFSSEAPGGGLPTGPTLDLVVYEAINFMDGMRTTSDIAGLLSAEYNRDFEQAWVDQLVGVLGRQQLVATK